MQTWGDPDYKYQSASLGKAFIRAVFGLAVDEGLIKPDDLIKKRGLVKVYSRTHTSILIKISTHHLHGFIFSTIEVDFRSRMDIIGERVWIQEFLYFRSGLSRQEIPSMTTTLIPNPVIFLERVIEAEVIGVSPKHLPPCGTRILNRLLMKNCLVTWVFLLTVGTGHLARSFTIPRICILVCLAMATL